MSLLMSFCNQRMTPSLSLLSFEATDLLNSSWVEFSSCNAEVQSGATGIEIADNRIFILSQLKSGNVDLLIYDYAFSCLHHAPLEKIKDGHSLVYHNSALYAVSSRNNSVYEIKLNATLDEPISVERYWTVPECSTENEDQVHLNSLVGVDGSFLVSCFGFKVDGKFSSTKHGLIYNISNNSIFHQNLHHPHTLKVLGNRLMVCESGTGLLHYSDEGNFSRLSRTVQLEGYIRGVAFDGEYYYVARSANRKQSRSLGTQNVDGNDQYPAVMYILDKDMELQKEVELKGYGAEAYDIQYLPAPVLGTENALRRRVEQLEELIDTPC